MQIDFKALEQALAPIEVIGQGELTFDAGGTTITLRVLRPSEEVDAQKFASKALESEDDHAAVEYLDMFRLGCLSYAIVAVGDQDFRGVEYVTTGEILSNGNPVRIPKHKAMQKLLSRWTRTALSSVFAKFHELALRTEAEAEKAIKLEPANIAAEIERLQQRIAELQGEKEKQQVAERTKFSATMAAIESGQVPSSPQDAEPEQPDDEQDEAEVSPPDPAPVQPPRRTGPITPQVAPPPPVRGTSAPAQPSQAGRRPQRPDSSFVNVDDEEAMNAAMAAEHERILEMRRRAAQGQAPVRDDSLIDQGHPQLHHPRHRPPHMDAAEVEQEVGAVATGSRYMGATEDGTPVYSLPAQDLEVPMARPPRDRNILNTGTADKGTRNPRFQTVRRP